MYIFCGILELFVGQFELFWFTAYLEWILMTPDTAQNFDWCSSYDVLMNGADWLQTDEKEFPQMYRCRWTLGSGAQWSQVASSQASKVRNLETLQLSMRAN